MTIFAARSSSSKGPPQSDRWQGEPMALKGNRKGSGAVTSKLQIDVNRVEREAVVIDGTSGPSHESHTLTAIV